MSYEIDQNQTAAPLMFLMIDSADHLAGKTGLSPTVTISKNGAAFGAPAGAVTEISVGWYKVAGNATDANTLGPLALHATSAGADPTDSLYRVVAPPATQASVDTIDDFLDTEVASTLAAVDTEVAAIKTQTDKLTFTVANQLDSNALTIAAAQITAIADGLLKRDMSAVTGEAARSPLNALRFLRNKWELAAGTLSVKKEDDATDAWTAAVSTDAAAVPVIGSDPA